MGMNLKDIYKQIPKDTDAIGLNLNFSLNGLTENEFNGYKIP